ncbi:hypothetical protein [uncultured Gimesia sp.]|uniref:hypothetical protein n=1 Tax=uncultured Gimesia sp. TaxID=1678688 RepID=UPI002637A6DF|nr:hypothetical protein [uncultured Gimesia sp.]
MRIVNEQHSEVDDSRQESLPTGEASGDSDATPREVRVRFAKYGAALFMVLGFAYQAFFNTTQSQTQRITELGVLMLVGFLLGWGFARLRF